LCILKSVLLRLFPTYTPLSYWFIPYSKHAYIRISEISLQKMRVSRTSYGHLIKKTLVLMLVFSLFLKLIYEKLNLYMYFNRQLLVIHIYQHPFCVIFMSCNIIPACRRYVLFFTILYPSFEHTWPHPRYASRASSLLVRI